MYLNERRYFPFTESKEEFPFDSQRNRERIYASESLTLLESGLGYGGCLWLPYDWNCVSCLGFAFFEF